MERSAQTPTPLSAPAGVWAAFLACSWTWCIGMFLPILLYRDFGVWGFLVFAGPNVVGAAAVGWIVRTPDSALRLLAKHRFAIGMFSAITIAFHIYWLAWIGSWVPTALGLDRSVVGAALGLALLALVALQVLSLRTMVAASVPLWLLSATVLGTIFGNGAASAPPPIATDEFGLLWLAPVTIFGFALCPYLDGTFLTARAAMTDTRAKFAFGVGFGVLFLAMIIGTIVYAPLLEVSLQGVVAAQWIGAILLVHLLLQTVFTVTVHRRVSPLAAVPAALLWALLLVAAFAAVLATRLAPHAGLSAGEIGYRAFLAFYGLAFPAYVWLVMIPGRSGTVDTRFVLRVWAAAVGIALPMFWMGFIERQEFWLAPGLLVVLLARLLVRRPSAPAIG